MLVCFGLANHRPTRAALCFCYGGIAAAVEGFPSVNFPSSWKCSVSVLVELTCGHRRG